MEPDQLFDSVRTEVELRDVEYRIWLRYSDGAEGEVDLSDIAGRGIFERWNEPGFFEKVYIASAEL